MHPEYKGLQDITVPVYNNIAIALDFSENDAKLLAYAIGQAKKGTHFTIVHVVESASATMHGRETNDYETQQDKNRLQFYVNEISNQGFEAHGILGFHERAKEIVRIVTEEKADLLIVGAHGHTGIKDLIYGSTVDAVRHDLKIPVLVVTL